MVSVLVVIVVLKYPLFHTLYPLVLITVFVIFSVIYKRNHKRTICIVGEMVHSKKHTKIFWVKTTFICFRPFSFQYNWKLLYNRQIRIKLLLNIYERLSQNWFVVYGKKRLLSKKFIDPLQSKTDLIHL